MFSQKKGSFFNLCIGILHSVFLTCNAKHNLAASRKLTKLSFLVIYDALQQRKSDASTVAFCVLIKGWYVVDRSV